MSEKKNFTARWNAIIFFYDYSKNHLAKLHTNCNIRALITCRYENWWMRKLQYTLMFISNKKKERKKSIAGWQKASKSFLYLWTFSFQYTFLYSPLCLCVHCLSLPSSRHHSCLVCRKKRGRKMREFHFFSHFAIIAHEK